MSIDDSNDFCSRDFILPDAMSPHNAAGHRIALGCVASRCQRHCWHITTATSQSTQLRVSNKSLSCLAFARRSSARDCLMWLASSIFACNQHQRKERGEQLFHNISLNCEASNDLVTTIKMSPRCADAGWCYVCPVLSVTQSNFATAFRPRGIETLLHVALWRGSTRYS